MDTQTAEYWIETLRLRKHPEGGYYREVYRSNETVSSGALPPRFRGERNLATSIYFLLPGSEVSRLHRLSADEVWHFYTGSSITLYIFHPSGEHRTIQLGSDAGRGEVFQAVVDHGSWSGAKVDAQDSFSLVGCTVAPGFDFDDFEIRTRPELLREFPGHREVIEALTAPETP